MNKLLTIPFVKAHGNGNDTIIFIEPEYESTYNYICTDPNLNCYPSVTDADNDGGEIVDTL